MSQKKVDYYKQAKANRKREERKTCEKLLIIRSLG